MRSDGRLIWPYTRAAGKSSLNLLCASRRSPYGNLRAARFSVWWVICPSASGTSSPSPLGRTRSSVSASKATWRPRCSRLLLRPERHLCRAGVDPALVDILGHYSRDPMHCYTRFSNERHSARSSRAVGVRAARRPRSAATTLAKTSPPTMMNTTDVTGTDGTGTASISLAKRSYRDGSAFGTTGIGDLSPPTHPWKP